MTLPMSGMTCNRDDREERDRVRWREVDGGAFGPGYLLVFFSFMRLYRSREKKRVVDWQWQLH